MKRSRLLVFVVVPLLLLFAGAGYCQDISLDAWSDFPLREVKRPALPARRGIRLSLSARSISTDRAFNKDGNLKDTDGAYDLFTTDINIGYGLHDRFEIYAGLPYISGEIGDVSGGDIGDIYAGFRGDVVRTDVFMLTLGLRVSYPSGDSEYHYELLGSGLNLQNFRTGDPGWNLYPEIEMRGVMGDVALRLRVVGVYTGSADVEFNRLGGFAETTKADPGDGYTASAGIIYQASDHWAPGLFINAGAISETSMDGNGLGDDRNWVEVMPQVLYQFSQEFEILLGAGYVVSGMNTPAGYPFMVRINTRF